MWKCPVCRAPYRNNPVCPRCQTDLLDLITIRNQAILHYNRALDHALQGEWEQALEFVEEAILHFHGQGEFHLLHGKILAHAHLYPEALKAWQQALALDSNLIQAQQCLEAFTQAVNAMQSSSVEAIYPQPE